LRVELLLGVLAQARGCPLERTVERGEVAALGLLEACSDSASRFGLVAVELLAERSLPGADPLAHLVESAAAFSRMNLDLVAPLFEERSAEALQLLAELGQREPLLLACGVDALCISCKTRLVGGDGLALLLAQLDELLLELALAAVEIGRPRHQALLQPLLDGSDGLGELDAGALRLALDRVAALFG